MSDLIGRIVEELTTKMNDLFVEGLRRKGFIFKNQSELINFISHSVKGITYRDTTTYFVKGIPFFEHQEVKPETYQTFSINQEIKIKASLGNYKFL